MEERKTQPCIEHQMTILPTTPVMPVALQRNTFAAQGSVRAPTLPFDRRARARCCNPDGGGCNYAPTHLRVCVCACDIANDHSVSHSLS